MVAGVGTQDELIEAEEMQPRCLRSSVGGKWVFAVTWRWIDMEDGFRVARAMSGGRRE